MRTSDVVIDGVGFMSLYHHDGKFVHGGGLFALARRDPDGGHTLFCLELAQDISRAAGPGHEAWSFAIVHGMNEILVHMAGSQQAPGEVAADATFPQVRYDLYAPEGPAAEEGLDGRAA